MNSQESATRKPKSIMIAGGGTGGHLYMGIALARAMLRRDPSCEFLFVGTRRGLESRIVPQEGFHLEYIDSAGLKGMRALNLVHNFLLIPRSLLQARRLVARHAPDIVIGVGGYSSGPVVLAGWWLGRPTLILEPNAWPGMTNRWLARVVDRAAVALPEAARHFRGKAVVTGVPVRPEFHRLPQKAPEATFTLLIYGGSQGSHALNMITCEALPDLKQLGSELSIIHQTGQKDLGFVRGKYEAAGLKADVRAFLPAIHKEFGRADLILSRAGASTVAELTAAGKAAILVPLPGAADDHQTRNAQSLEKIGAAKLIPEKDWAPGRLEKEIRHLMCRRDEVGAMGEAARKAGRPDAAERIAELVLSAIEENKPRKG